MNKEQMRNPTKLERQILEKKWTAAVIRERKNLKLVAETRVAVVMLPLLILLLLTSFNTLSLCFSASVLVVSLTRILRKLARDSRKIRGQLQKVETGNYLVADGMGSELIPAVSPRKQPHIQVRVADGLQECYPTMRYLAKSLGHGEDMFPVLLVQLEGEETIYAIPRLS